MHLEIFMPFYGDIEHFKRAVTSVCNQSDPDWTLTILDDVYPSDVPSSFVSQLNDARIKYKRNHENLGVSGNFQQCVELARADFITIMGCDDLLLPNFVTHTKEIIKANPQVSYIQPGVQVIDEHDVPHEPLGDRVKRKLRDAFAPPTLIKGELLATSLLKGCWTYFPSITWRTSELKKYSFREDFRIVLDLALQLEIISHGGELYIDNVETFAYRRHRASVSMKSALDGTRFLEEIRLFTEFKERAIKLGWKRAAWAAQLHWTSRLNAFVELSPALLSGNYKGSRILLKHIFGK